MKKGLVFDIRRYSVHDGPGIRTTVFLKGCPLKCAWCHNPEGILPEPQNIIRTRKFNGKEKRFKETAGRWMTVDEVMKEIREDRLFFEESGGGVTFSGGEPIMQAGFLYKVLLKCKEEGIHSAVDTSGHAETPEILRIANMADLLLFDLKSADNIMHLAHTGADNKLILKNLSYLAKRNIKMIIRIPVIPGFNSEVKHMEAILEILGKLRSSLVRVDLLPWHSIGLKKYEALGMPVPSGFSPVIDNDHMQTLLQLFSNRGFEVKKGG